MAYKRIKEHQALNLKATKEQLDAITSLLEDKEKMKNKFLVEQVFNYKFGNYIPFTVISLLLSFKNPTEAINNWVIAKSNLITEFEPARFSFRGRMGSKKYRATWVWVNIAGYFIFSFFGLGLLFSLPKVFVAVHYSWVIGAGAFVLCLLYFSYEFIMSARSIRVAQVIMEEFEKIEKNNKQRNSDSGTDAPPPVR
jgi:hypothetical protein